MLSLIERLQKDKNDADAAARETQTRLDADAATYASNPYLIPYLIPISSLSNPYLIPI